MQGIPEHGHEAVMVEEVLRGLALEDRARSVSEGHRSASGGERLTVMDCTAGRGGHLVRMGEAMGRGGGGLLIGLDVDPENLKYARKRVENAGVETGGGTGLKGVELRTFHANFAEAGDVLEALGLRGVDALLADFGVSTNQLLDEKHGLSFQSDSPLDMRLDPRIRKKAADLIAEWDEKTLATALQEYAQERYAWRIARKIVQTRAAQPIQTTGQLARLVRSVVPPSRSKTGPIDPSTRTFQALRMAVNAETESISDLMAAMPELLNPEGRAVFISFHSGEDRLVKQAVRGWEEAGLAEALTKKPLEPSEGEMNRNTRSRSAKLRAIRWIGPEGKDAGRAATKEAGVHG